MSLVFKAAALIYGNRLIPVKPDPQITPFPSEFDPGDPARWGLGILQLMARACGGHALHDARVMVIPGVSAVASANGACVRYGLREPRVINAERAIQELDSMQFFTIGTVTPYGAAPEGPKPAVQHSPRRWRPQTDRRVEGYNPEFLGAKPAKQGEDY